MSGYDNSDWQQARTRIFVGCTVSGKVEAVRPFGLFVKLDLGPLALLLRPHMDPAYEKRGDPDVGESIVARVAVIDEKQQQIALTQLNPDPWYEGHARPLGEP